MRILYLLLLLLASGLARAQYSQYWVRYHLQLQTGRKTEFHLEVDDRRFFKDHTQSQFVVHTHFHYKVTPMLDAGAGGSYLSTHSLDDPDRVIPEWRLFQEVYADCFAGSSVHRPLSFRFRIDERFLQQKDAMEPDGDNRYITRARVRIQTAWQLAAFNEGKQRLMFRISDEVMLQWGDVSDAFDQNRVFVAMNYTFDRRFSLECGYLDIYQSAGADRRVQRNAVRLTLVHRPGRIRSGSDKRQG